MIEQIVKERSTLLFKQRVKDAESFWERTNPEKRKFLLGTSMLMDGNISKGKEIIEQLPPSFQNQFNLMTAYKQKNNINGYEELRKELVKQYEMQLNNMENKKLKKNVAFFLSYLGNTGAIKMLMLHKQWLEEVGFHVDMFVPYSEKNKIIPYTLFNERVELRTYHTDKDLRKIASKYDIAFAPHWDHLFPLYQHFNKVFFFSQGDYDVFSEDFSAINLLRNFYWLPLNLFTVSNFLQGHIFRKQFRNPKIIPCGIDLNIFYPGEKFEKQTILVVGSAAVPQKHISDVLTYLLFLKQTYNFEIVWINPLENVRTVEGITVVNNPDKETLASYYRKSHIFISGSEIESFSLPPLEAMASGTAVIAANNGGILQYAKQGENIIMFEPNNWNQMTNYTELLLKDENKRNYLINNGLKSAEYYSIPNMKHYFLSYIHDSLENYFFTK